MPTKNFPSDTIEQAAAVLAACKQINPDMKAGAMTQEMLANELVQTRSIQAQINNLELQIVDLRNKRDQRLSGIWESVKRTRTIVKGTYGDDSSEYEMVGGTRMSERRKSLRKPAT
jgi:predicted unusual protein kinase regulating ubiquinone biosynthesis (AarF/ABC1/UbiB family)